MVADVWRSETHGNSAMDRWQCKIRSLHQHLRGLAKHMAGHHEKEKKKLISLIDSLDKKAETIPLSDDEINYKDY